MNGYTQWGPVIGIHQDIVTCAIKRARELTIQALEMAALNTEKG